MKPRLNRRQVEMVAAAMLAALCVTIAVVRGEGTALGPKHLELRPIGTFAEPVYLAQPPKQDNLLFVVERRGEIRVVQSNRPRPAPFLDIRDRVEASGPAQGLFSLAFPPDYDDTGLFYVSYTGRGGNLEVVEYRRDGHNHLRARSDSARPLLRIEEPGTRDQGGLLQFGPDGYLYIGTGDGDPAAGSAAFGAAQERTSLLGKILRIDPLPSGGRPYSVPADNPFAGRTGGRDEIYALGLRQPWRFSFDRAVGALAIGDVGQDRFEEINLLPAGRARGANFGWPGYEGYARFGNEKPPKHAVPPVLAYPHDRGCAVIGGYVVRDRQLRNIKGPEIVGHYLFGDHCAARLSVFRPKLGQSNRRQGKDRVLRRLRVKRLTSFGEDNAGHIYIVSQNGTVYRLLAKRVRR